MKLLKTLLLIILLGEIRGSVVAYELVETNRFTPTPYFPLGNETSIKLYWVTDNTIILEIDRYDGKIVFIDVHTGEVVYEIFKDRLKYIRLVDKEFGIFVLKNLKTDEHSFIEVPTGIEYAVDAKSLEAFHKKIHYIFYNNGVVTIGRLDTKTFERNAIFTIEDISVLPYSNWEDLKSWKHMGISAYRIRDFNLETGAMVLNQWADGIGSYPLLITFLNNEIQDFKINLTAIFSHPLFLNDNSIITTKYDWDYERPNLQASGRYNPVILDKDFKELYKNKEMQLAQQGQNFDLSPDKSQMVTLVEGEKDIDKDGRKDWEIGIYDIYTSVAHPAHSNKKPIEEREPLSTPVALPAGRLGTVNDNNVNIRTWYTLESKKLYQVHGGDKLLLIERTKEKYTIGDMEDYWYKGKVIKKNGEDYEEKNIRYEYIWIYGAFIDISEIKQDEEPQEEKENKVEEELYIVEEWKPDNILIAGVMVLMMFGLVLLILKRRAHKGRSTDSHKKQNKTIKTKED